MTDKPKTFEEALQEAEHIDFGLSEYRLKYFWTKGFCARDPELAEKDRRIAELEREGDNALLFGLEIISALGYRTVELQAEIKAGGLFPSKQAILETIGQLEESKARVAALEARIAAGMALAKRMEQAGMVYWTNEFRAALKGES